VVDPGDRPSGGRERNGDPARPDGQLEDGSARPFGERVAKVTTARHDAATATVELRTWFDTWPSDGGPLERISRLDRLRLVGADELAGWLRAAGLEVESLGGDWDMRPFGPGADRLVAIARRTDRGGAAGA
jgi:hypothetical protein